MITESAFTNRFSKMDEESLAEFVMIYSLLLSAQAQTADLESNARRIAKSVLSAGDFESFKPSLDDYYNAISALTSKATADRFGLSSGYRGLETAVHNFLVDISQGTYTSTKAERHLYNIQRATKMTGNSMLSDLRRHGQEWAGLTDIEKKVHTERLKNLMTNLYSGSSGITQVKKLSSEFGVTAKEKSIILPAVVATVGGFMAGRALGKKLAK